MPRQFFVGGNFKMNPCSIDDKKALIKILNEADLDPSTGTPILRMSYRTVVLNVSTLPDHRGRHCSPIALLDPRSRDRQEGDQGLGSELLLQVVWRVHRGDQVCILSLLDALLILSYPTI